MQISGQKLTAFAGTPAYAAPSVLKGEYGPEADLWSLGVVAYVLLCGHLPYTGTSAGEVYQSMCEQTVDFSRRRWKFVSAEAKDFVSRLLEKDDSKRLTLQEVVGEHSRKHYKVLIQQGGWSAQNLIPCFSL